MIQALGGIFPTSEQRVVEINTHDFYPAIKQGWCVLVEAYKNPGIDDYVLIKFKNGQQTIKVLLQTKPGGYLLQSVNTDEQMAVVFDELDGYAQVVVAIVPPGCLTSVSFGIH